LECAINADSAYQESIPGSDDATVSQNDGSTEPGCTLKQISEAFKAKKTGSATDYALFFSKKKTEQSYGIIYQR
jgi:hypothetical protein